MKGFTLLLILFFSINSFGQNVIVLGIAQDGGFPHIGCEAPECIKAYKDPSLARYVVSLALVDPATKKWWLFEATPDMVKQLHYFQELTEGTYPYLPEGIFVTHAHIGHYTGLMHLGREALGARGVSVYCLPRMAKFLSSNGPWEQLVRLENIKLQTMENEVAVTLSNSIKVTAKEVPHRDEYSETAGFWIETAQKDYLFIPDIDKWEKWDRNIVEEVKQVDIAFIDGTFFADGELPNRPMEEVPHPFVVETMELFKDKTYQLKRNIQFIHLNHTNPLLFDKKVRNLVLKQGFGIAIQGETY